MILPRGLAVRNAALLMHLDVTELRDFYYRSALGRAAQRVIRDELL